VNHKELLERIDRLQKEEEMKKQILVSGFSTFKKQMMPGEIAKRLLRNSVQKVKSFLPHFLSRPKSKVIKIGDSRLKSGTIENDGSRLKLKPTEYGTSRLTSKSIENETHAHEKN
jgi:hypothetical protein